MKPKHEIPWRRHKEVAEKYKRDELIAAKIKEWTEAQDRVRKERERLDKRWSGF